jgi:predicted molibdopterin-dependent oxidoreductase YjgC
VHVCNHEIKKSILDFSHRGLAVCVQTFNGRPLAEQACGDCMRCAEVCPTGALFARKPSGEGLFP